MSKEIEQMQQEVKRELADVELSIEQAADQGDTATVEHFVEQERYLNTKLKLIANQLS